MLTLNFQNWLLAFLPVFILLFTLMGLKIKTGRAAIISWLIALLVAIFIFGLTLPGFLVATGKALSLSLFVLLIIWSAVILYNLVKQAGAAETIADKMIGFTENKAIQLLLMAWCFSSFIQGVSGFGVPVAIIAPLLVAMGFKPLIAAAATLIGHSWSVTMGSMASSFYTLQLVTRLEPVTLSFWLGLLFLFSIWFCGISVIHLYSGLKGVKKLLPLITVSALIMGAFLWAVPLLGAPQLGSVLAGFAGSLFLILTSRKDKMDNLLEPEKDKLSFKLAVFPYLFLIIAIIIFQIPFMRELTAGIKLAFSFPEVVTEMGYVVPAVENYAAIRLFAHPAPFILLAVLVSAVLYNKRGHWEKGTVNKIYRQTLKQCLPTTVSISFLVMMALIMNDAGMTDILARGIANFSGVLFPVFSPFIGLLGSFITGSNTNSNVLFGLLQKEAALSLGINSYIIVSAQTVGGSLGSAVTPAKAVLGASTVNMTGKEGDILRKTLFYCLLNVFFIGLINLILVTVF